MNCVNQKETQVSMLISRNPFSYTRSFTTHTQTHTHTHTHARARKGGIRDGSGEIFPSTYPDSIIFPTFTTTALHNAVSKLPIRLGSPLSSSFTCDGVL